MMNEPRVGNEARQSRGGRRAGQAAGSKGGREGLCGSREAPGSGRRGGRVRADAFGRPWTAEPANARQAWRTGHSRLLLVQADICALPSRSSLRSVCSTRASLTAATSRAVACFACYTFALDRRLKAAGLDDRDDEVIQHSRLDEVPTLLTFATVGVGSSPCSPGCRRRRVDFGQLVLFRALAASLLPLLRTVVRWRFRRDPDFPQNTVIVGAGSVGQLLGRKLLHTRSTESTCWASLTPRRASAAPISRT